MLDGRYAAEVEGYVDAVLTGRKKACTELVQSCRRFRRDIESGRFDIRCEEADYVIEKIETQFVHRQGEDLAGLPLLGKPLLLEPWEKYIIYGILIFYHPGTILRRYKEAFIFIPRKNGKTLLVAALAWALALLSVKSGATIYIAAAALKQAMESFNNIKHNLTNHLYDSQDDAEDDGWRILDNNNVHAISNEDIGGGWIKLEALAANPDRQDSLNCNIAIADEIHAFKSAKQYNIIRDAMKAYANKLMIGISTAGDGGRHTFCAQRLAVCQRILASETEDAYSDQLFIFICKAAEDKDGNVDYLNPDGHEKANPNYGVTIRPNDMIAGALEAQNDPQQRKEFIQKSLNVFVSPARAYFNLHEFRNSDRKYTWTLDELAALPVKWYGGADLSKLHDLTAAVLYGVYQGVDIIVPHCWFPIEAAYKKAEEDNIPLFGWKDDGWLTMSNAPTVNHADVVAWFVKMRERGFRIAEVGHDRKFCREYFVAMKKARFRIIDQPQYFYKKSEGFRHIEVSAKNGTLYYLHADPYEYCVENVHAIEKTDDMVMYEKIDDNTRIDVFDASVFACIRMLENMERDANKPEWED
ncbi:MAG: terminase large subunit [Clostridia bacterium]|nr:terminase large subunit [Clostridia bacterium]